MHSGKQNPEYTCADLTQLAQILGHPYEHPELLFRAVTHSSYANEMHSKGQTLECNERMEFLGDSVLSIVTSDYLFHRYPKMPEGDLSKVRSGAVCEKALSAYARSMGLGNFILLGHGEELSNGRDRSSILADAFEAVLASLYLDGGFEPVKSFVLPYITAEVEDMLSQGRTEDYKTILQQIVQQDQGERLEYVLISESGPAHKRVFEVEAHLNSNVIGHGVGSSKREAEQMAAKQAVALFGGGV